MHYEMVLASRLHVSWIHDDNQVFSKLDTKSLMQVSACCTMLNKCAMDPLCYSHIDLTTAFQHADDRVLSTLINLSGKQLRCLHFLTMLVELDDQYIYVTISHWFGCVYACRSLKLGRRDAPGYVPSLFTNSCLAPLQFTGYRLLA